jgi:uncharacterized membrane protein
MNIVEIKIMKKHKLTMTIWILLIVFTIISGLSIWGICVDEVNGNQYWPILEGVALFSFCVWIELLFLTLLSPFFWLGENCR